MEKVKKFAKSAGYWLAATVVGTAGCMGSHYLLNKKKNYADFLAGVTYVASAYGCIRLADRMIES